MAKTTRKTTTKGKASTAGKSSGTRRAAPAPSAKGKHLVIVESPTKAKTINKYLGPGYVVMASVGHVRDLPTRAPKGVKQDVPGVDLENDFAPTYEVLSQKKKTVTELKRAAKQAQDVWFATDLDREGEAIAWHLAEALGLPSDAAKRVVFNAITKDQIQQAFASPRAIDANKVDAQQARRVLDRIVGYQISPLLWKKVAGGLSAGRVQSVAVAVVVQREREIEAFEPQEYWKVTAYLTTKLDSPNDLGDKWLKWLAGAPEGKSRTVKEQLAWLAEHNGVRAELVEVAGQPFKPENREQALKLVRNLGFVVDGIDETIDPKGKGAAKNRALIRGRLENPAAFAVRSIKTKRVRSRPPAPLITSTMQQAASNQLGFSLSRSMRIAQQLYEGIDLGGARGQTGLITYMRTDSTHIAPQAIDMVRSHIESNYGERYLPKKPNTYASSNKSAQEAHEAIRPTDVAITPDAVRTALTDDQFKLYQLIWRRFVASQMVPAEWDSTTIMIAADRADAAFKATGRTLVFDGFYKVTGVPGQGDEAILPVLAEQQQLAPIHLDPTQHFTSPPPRYTEASLQKKLEEEGIGRPSTYAPIIQTIQDRKYVQQLGPKDRRLYATDLGKVVTDKLVEGFPDIMNLAYTREMEAQLDKIEEDHHDWVTMLRNFYGPFRQSLDKAHESMVHAKAQTEPAPYKCAKCEADTFYRFGKNGRFLSCSRYPDCDYAAPIDREGKPMTPQLSDVLCPLCGSGMTRRVGRFGPFLGCENYPTCKGIVKLDPKKGTVVLPKPPPLLTDLACTKCDSPLNLRRSKRGPWLSCSAFPKCRGRMGWTTLDDDKQAELEKALAKHEDDNPQPQIRNTQGQVIPEGYAPQITDEDAESPDQSPDTDLTTHIDSDAA